MVWNLIITLNVLTSDLYPGSSLYRLGHSVVCSTDVQPPCRPAHTLTLCCLQYRCTAPLQTCTHTDIMLSAVQTYSPPADLGTHWHSARLHVALPADVLNDDPVWVRTGEMFASVVLPPGNAGLRVASGLADNCDVVSRSHLQGSLPRVNIWRH